MVYVLLFLACAYILLLMVLVTGWRKLTAPEKTQQCEHFLSVIVPFRNEAQCIRYLTEDLKHQSYTSFEVLLVDDHSSDDSVEILKKITSGSVPFRIITNESAGKKHAITTGVKEAKGTIIVTTDADCRLPASWLSCINQQFQDADVMMVCGGVAITEDNTWFSKLQALEFASLIGSGAAMTGLHHPVMCNGANLSFRREAFERVHGYEGNLTIASGDDEFLMRKITQVYKNGIRFMRGKESVVNTSASPSLGVFLQQRFRWAGKWRHNSSWTAKVLAVYILLLQVSLIAAMGMLFSGDDVLMYTAAGILFIRACGEFFFLYPVSKFLNVRWRWDVFFVLQFLYPFYVVITGLFSNFIPNTWKGRKL